MIKSLLQQIIGRMAEERTGGMGCFKNMLPTDTTPAGKRFPANSIAAANTSSILKSIARHPVLILKRSNSVQARGP